jgi:hypothetical protein
VRTTSDRRKTGSPSGILGEFRDGDMARNRRIAPYNAPDKTSLIFSEAAMIDIRSTNYSWLLAVVAVVALLAAGCRENTANSGAVGDEAERWYGIYLQGAKVGHSVTRTRTVEEDGQTLVETTSSMTLVPARGSTTTPMKMSATSVETTEGEMLRFNTTTVSGKGPVTASGRVSNGQLAIASSTTGAKSLKWSDEYRGIHAWEKILAHSPPGEGEVRRFQALHELFLVVVPNRLVGGKWEETSTPSGTKKLRRFDHRMTLPDGSQQLTQIWTDASGTWVKSRLDAQDIELHRMPREAALAEPTETINLVDDTMIRLDPPIANPRGTKWVRYRVTFPRGAPERAFATGPMQAVRGVDQNTVELVVRAVSPTTQLSEATGGETFAAEGAAPDSTFLKPNHYIAANDPRVAAMARTVATDERDPWRLAVALEQHVHTAIEQFDYGQAFLTAAEVIETGKGDCSEYAVLLAAILRARGIPSRVAIGLVYVENAAAMGYHMWTEAWINGRWVGLDATQGAGGIAADHIKVAATSLEGGLADPALLSLGQLLGAKPKIEVIESQYRE